MKRPKRVLLDLWKLTQDNRPNAGVTSYHTHGDAEDRAIYRCAALRASGADPGARVIIECCDDGNGPRFVAKIQRSTGEIEVM